MAFQMQSHHVRHLPVIDQGRFVGMLSLRDILRELLSTTRAELREITAYIQTGEVALGSLPPDEPEP
jgi:CBS domain-containing protein